ncbi:hypothetical protein A2U01_0096991, partial [Trifolium medium]|nr:hypothetical protein [Trifolium medium]
MECKYLKERDKLRDEVVEVEGKLSKLKLNYNDCRKKCELHAGLMITLGQREQEV